MANLPHAIKGVVTERKEDTALITLSTGESVRLPTSLFSEAAVVGSDVHLAVFSDAEADAEQERLAKAVLVEMLRGE